MCYVYTHIWAILLCQKTWVNHCSCAWVVRLYNLYYPSSTDDVCYVIISILVFISCTAIHIYIFAYTTDILMHTHVCLYTRAQICWWLGGSSASIFFSFFLKFVPICCFSGALLRGLCNQRRQGMSICDWNPGISLWKLVSLTLHVTFPLFLRYFSLINISS